MGYFGITVADVVQVVILLVAVVTVVNNHGSRIKFIEKNVDTQRRNCSVAMESVVLKPVLNAKLETLSLELVHLHKGQQALSGKVDDIYDLLREYAKTH